jgi:hypothetical protein
MREMGGGRGGGYGGREIACEGGRGREDTNFGGRVEASERGGRFSGEGGGSRDFIKYDGSKTIGRVGSGGTMTNVGSAECNEN